MSSIKIGVVGAGVIGLSAAVNIIENIPNVDVTIMADAFSPNTTGDSSAGFWEPYVSSGDNIRKWSKITFDHMCYLAKSQLAGRLGAQFCSGYQLGQRNVEWSDIVFGYRPMSEQEMAIFSHTGATEGSFFTTVMIECSMYLPWLMLRFKEKGGRVLNRKVNSLQQLSEEFDLVVNCCGLSAREMLNDHMLKPIRGQVIKVQAPWIKHFVIHDGKYDAGDVAYILPGAKGITLGGKIQEGNYNTTIEAKDKQGIWKRCLDLVPSLKEAKYMFDWVGLRPFRPQVRLELEEMTTAKGKLFPVIHNYGHGGSGVTVHWGCALDTLEITRQAIQKYFPKYISTPSPKL